MNLRLRRHVESLYLMQTDLDIQIEKAFQFRRVHPDSCDISEHMDTLLRYGKECETITEFGTRRGTSTLCWVMASPKRIRCYDIEPQRLSDWDVMKKYIREKGIDFHLINADTRCTDIDPVICYLLIRNIHLIAFRLSCGGAGTRPRNT